MRCIERGRVAAARLAAGAIVVAVLASCGGGTSTETTISGAGVAGGGTGVTEVDATSPTGPNTTEIVVDAGPSAGFSLGAANVPYVTVTVCAPGSATDCVTVDHVFLDTGSIGLRLLKSTVGTLALPAVSIPADAVSGTPAGAALECYPFVLGAVWGPLVQADVHVGGEVAAAIPIQLIDDAASPVHTVPSDCVTASNGTLLNSVATMQANGILGIGMIAYDCGLNCINGDYSSGYTLYYSCPVAAGAACVPASIPGALQMQNPIVHFAVDNNGSVITLPALPALGAGIAKGRLVFGIGTQTNNQIPPAATLYFADARPTSPTYLYFSTTVGATTYANSYVDSGSNAYFFDDSSIAQGCQSSAGVSGGWYCPATAVARTATLTDAIGTSGTVDFTIANADGLFGTSSLAFDNIGGMAGQGSSAFVWGLPFFYGRSVFTSIWGQVLSPNGPWNAF
jgi:hypothetical protein